MVEIKPNRPWLEDVADGSVELTFRDGTTYVVTVEEAANDD